MSGELMVFLAPGVAALVVTGLGVAARGSDHASRSRAALITVAAVAALVLAISAVDPDTPISTAIAVTLLAALVLGALPVLIFFQLGLAVRPAWLLSMLWTIAAAAFTPGALVGWLVVALVLGCPPSHPCFS